MPELSNTIKLNGNARAHGNLWTCLDMIRNRFSHVSKGQKVLMIKRNTLLLVFRNIGANASYLPRPGTFRLWTFLPVP